VDPQRDAETDEYSATAFGHLLRGHRRAAALTQEELAERAMLSVEAISKLERGTSRRPQRETLRLLFDALGLSARQRKAAAAAARKSMATPRRVQGSAASPSALPVPATPLIGRAADLAAVSALLRDRAVRLVTITGLPGVGKTRLAIAAAGAMETEGTAAIVFVPLSAIREPKRVVASIAHALHIPGADDETAYDRLVAYLQSRTTLLVLDNFEQVLAAAPIVADLLTACADLNVLVTSRAALRMASEHIYALAPLALPDAPAMLDAAVLRRVPAIDMFVRRACAAEPAFRLTEANAEIVVAICDRLDGLPLALELAASRARVLTPAAMLARLEQPMALLTSEAVDLPARQRTLRDTLAWSYDLLTPDEQALFRCLGIFVDGWTLEAAERVAQPVHTLGIAVLDGIESLIAKSLVQVDRSAGEPRYVMLETIREYAFEQLSATTEIAAVAQAHAACFLCLVGTMEERLTGPDQVAVAARLDAEYENLRSAMRWVVTHGHTEFGLRFGLGLWRFWLARGWHTEGRKWLAKFLGLAQAKEHTVLYGSARVAAGALAVDQCDHDAAREHLSASLVIASETGDRALMATAHAQLGRWAREQGDLATARTHSERSLAMRRGGGTPWQVAASLQLAGRAALDQHDLAAANAYLDEGLDIARTIGDRSLLANVLRDLGELALMRGDAARAAQLLVGSLAHYREVGHPWSMARCLDALASAALDLGKPADAVRLLATAATMREAMGSPAGPPDQPRVAETITKVRSALDAEAFREAWREGRVRPAGDTLATVSCSLQRAYPGA
jgi:predicted ATPase